MKNFPEKYRQKLETIKRAILIRSGMLSEYGDNIELRLVNYDLTKIDGQNETKFYELVFLLRIKTNIDCSDCAHNSEDIIIALNEVKNKIYKGATFYIDEDLTIKSGNSLRGILTTSFNYYWDDIEDIEFELFYDVGESY